MIRNSLFVTILLITMTGLGAESLAQEAVYQGTHRDWRVFTRGEGEDRICYTLSRPTDQRPADVDHGSVFFLVSRFANGAADEQPNFVAGYPLMPDRAPSVRVGSRNYQMYVSGQEGFLEELSAEERLVAGMRRGSTMRVEAMSTRGTATAYTFSLSGITAALRQVEELCD